MTAVEEMLSKYDLNNEDQYRQAFKEVMQEIVLCGLSRGGLFEKAAFTGGTALRIVHGIKRFSEDLDFSLLKPDSSYSFEKYLPYIRNELVASGFDIEFGKLKENTTVKSAFVKADTYKLILNFSSIDPDFFHIRKGEKIRVKLEVDTNPPAGANYEELAMSLPSPYIIRVLDMPSMFALKCHALMCRNYIKGRDYYDYQWFLSQNISINGKLLQNALFQTEGKTYSIHEITDRLENVFSSVDIGEIKKDVRRFLENPETIDKWSNELFVRSIAKIQILETARISDDLYKNNLIQNLVVIAGIPGAGKQKEAEKYRKLMPAAVYIRTNDIREEMNTGTSPEDNDMVIATAYKQIKDALKCKKDVIYVATNLDKGTRNDILHLADGLQDRKINKLLDVVYKDPKEIQQDAAYHIPGPVLRNMATILNNSSPDIAEGWDKIITTGRQPTRNEIYSNYEALEEGFGEDCNCPESLQGDNFDVGDDR